MPWGNYKWKAIPLMKKMFFFVYVFFIIGRKSLKIILLDEQRFISLTLTNLSFFDIKNPGDAEAAPLVINPQQFKPWL